LVWIDGWACSLAFPWLGVSAGNGSSLLELANGLAHGASLDTPLGIWGGAFSPAAWEAARHPLARCGGGRKVYGEGDRVRRGGGSYHIIILAAYWQYDRKRRPHNQKGKAKAKSRLFAGNSYSPITHFTKLKMCSFGLYFLFFYFFLLIPIAYLCCGTSNMRCGIRQTSQSSSSIQERAETPRSILKERRREWKKVILFGLDYSVTGGIVRCIMGPLLLLLRLNGCHSFSSFLLFFL